MLTSVSSSSNSATVPVMQGHGIGAYIRRLREDRGWSQVELADRAEVNRAHLSQVEIGRIALPSAEMRRKLAATLGVRHVDLLMAAGELTADEIPQEGAVRDPFPRSVTKQTLVDHISTLTDEEAGNVLNYLRFTFGLRGTNVTLQT